MSDPPLDAASASAAKSTVMLEQDASPVELGLQSLPREEGAFLVRAKHQSLSAILAVRARMPFSVLCWVHRH